MLSLVNAPRGTDRFLVERMQQWIPGWNRRQLSYDEFERYASSLGITVVECPLTDADGYAFFVGAAPYIYVNANLTYSEKVIVAYHELKHILYDPERPEVFIKVGSPWYWFSKMDRQAKIAGAVAWMPEAAVRGLSIEELMIYYDVPRPVAEFRAGLDLWRV